MQYSFIHKSTGALGKYFLRFFYAKFQVVKVELTFVGNVKTRGWS